MSHFDGLPGKPPRERGIFCNRTMNMRSIKAIGYDMDYTLIHYQVEEWERLAYEHLRTRLVTRGYPVEDLRFDSELVIRGLIIDTELGNLLKVNRFGYVKRAMHGTSMLDFEPMRAAYARTIIDLAEPRFVFLNTLFSLSEACMYAQLVDLADAGKMPAGTGYEQLYRLVKSGLDEAHMEGRLKAEIIADPDRFVVLDPEAPLALLDQQRAGKKLLLITNSEWGYTDAMMRYAFERFLPNGMRWRDLFDVVIVQARKPDFFMQKSPLFEVVSEDGLLRPWIGPLKEGGSYLGGDATQVERSLGISGDEILYVGDHIWGDVRVSKSVLRWRTALILWELEEEVRSAYASRVDEARLGALMEEKEALELAACQLRLLAQRHREAYGLPGDAPSCDEVLARLGEIKTALAELDDRIAPLAKAAAEVSNPRWGLLLRTGNDKSHLARQIERSADIYTSRVSNFLRYTPYSYFRSRRGSLPHDPSGEAPSPNPGP
ncbi:HAD-IG family 5'-nucleotidase [Polyangium sp. y55x31]|uniref:HAD-IG family 5'-nucleotidase n=1 Tax=Polyangium sp. y55x31 TaxID=3042688 RepID=UPI0024826775|nr:HAD-IG family 5'-nucleotidase [Polyangium sp. y55x31]MDI1477585.1 HAD-IG family 5'-nucleotidase [Polyangium sp. y55x31]